jgi:hypothetical protein
VLSLGGELRFFDHVRSMHPLGGIAQDLITPIWSRVGGGCHLNRDLAADIRAAGFSITHLDRIPTRRSSLLRRRDTSSVMPHRLGERPPTRAARSATATLPGAG